MVSYMGWFLLVSAFFAVFFDIGYTGFSGESLIELVCLFGVASLGILNLSLTIVSVICIGILNLISISHCLFYNDGLIPETTYMVAALLAGFVALTDLYRQMEF